MYCELKINVTTTKNVDVLCKSTGQWRLEDGPGDPNKSTMGGYVHEGDDKTYLFNFRMTMTDKHQVGTSEDTLETQGIVMFIMNQERES